MISRRNRATVDLYSFDDGRHLAIVGTGKYGGIIPKIHQDLGQAQPFSQRYGWVIHGQLGAGECDRRAFCDR